jgi:ATP-dependent protease HslVU (ClpYQ) peptidase subunit
MTTVAYDGYTLAGDSLATYGDTKLDIPIPKVQVLYNNKWKAMAWCGQMSQAEKVKEWIIHSGQEKPETEGCRFMLIDQDNKPWLMDQHLIPVPLPIPFALGNGENFAIGAMAAGKSAKEAIEIASKYDAFTGGEIFEVKII